MMVYKEACEVAIKYCLENLISSNLKTNATMKNFNVTLLVGLKNVTLNVTAENEEQAKKLAKESVKVNGVEVVRHILCHNPSHNKDLVALMNGIVVDTIKSNHCSEDDFYKICEALVSRDFDEVARFVDSLQLLEELNETKLSYTTIDILLNNVCDDVDLAQIILFVCRSYLKRQDWEVISSVLV